MLPLPTSLEVSETRLLFLPLSEEKNPRFVAPGRSKLGAADQCRGPNHHAVISTLRRPLPILRVLITHVDAPRTDHVFLRTTRTIHVVVFAVKTCSPAVNTFPKSGVDVVLVVKKSIRYIIITCGIGLAPAPQAQDKWKAPWPSLKAVKSLLFRVSWSV